MCAQPTMHGGKRRVRWRISGRSRSCRRWPVRHRVWRVPRIVADVATGELRAAHSRWAAAGMGWGSRGATFSSSPARPRSSRWAVQSWASAPAACATPTQMATARAINGNGAGLGRWFALRVCTLDVVCCMLRACCTRYVARGTRPVGTSYAMRCVLRAVCDAPCVSRATRGCVPLAACRAVGGWVPAGPRRRWHGRWTRRTGSGVPSWARRRSRRPSRIAPSTARSVSRSVHSRHAAAARKPAAAKARRRESPPQRESPPP